jgi:DNA (cytosine-5)-methyltransferase 1
MRARKPTNPSVTAVDLFCGVGGLTHGLQQAGVTVVAGVDLDGTCRYPFESNNSARFIEADVTDISADDIGPLFGDGLKLLAGCAPCQSFSTYSQSGRSRKRGNDWQLVSSFGRLVRELKPDLVTMENVPQLVAHPVFTSFLKDLSDYDVRWGVIDCSRVGVPQSRRRLVLMASLFGGGELDLPIQSNRLMTVRDAIGKLPPLMAGEQDDRDHLHFACSLSPINMKRIQASTPGGTWRDWEPSLQTSCHRKKSGTTYPSVYGRMEWDKVAPTITTQCFGYGNGRFGHPEQDRAISLREAAMLQTFPRSYVFVPDGELVRFNKLGRLIGNAVPVQLGKSIGLALGRHVRA